MKQNIELLTFNRGLISRLGLARNDLDRLRLSASLQNNWMPRTLGSMMIRPGFEYVVGTKDNEKPYYIDFVYSNSDTALIELTDENMRVLVEETPVTRASVSTAVTNGDFTLNLNGWSDQDETGAVSQHDASGFMSLTGTRYTTAIRRQEVTVGGADQNVEHGLQIVVERGPVYIKLGQNAGGEEYLRETYLGEGTHSITFTPIGNFWIDLIGKEEYEVLVDSCNVEASGIVDLAAPWAAADLPLVRYSQSGNAIYANCDGYPQYIIERVDTGNLATTKKSWSIVKYQPVDGPFRLINITPTRLTPSGLTGDITISANRDTFTSGNVGALYRLTSTGQQVSITITGEAQWSDPIRVTGTGSQRVFSVTRATLAGNATATLQRSVGEPGSWTDVATYTTNGTSNYDDGLDNQIIFYRIGVDTGDYSSNTPVLSMDYSAGGIVGVVRITAFTNAQSVSANVLSALGSTDATEDWEEGEWSDRRGYPTSVSLYEGRLWHAGRSALWGSASDAYESFDDQIEGDSRPIKRTIGQGPVDTINWIKPSQRLVLGGEGSEWVARSSTFDEPLTQDNINLKDPSNQGSAAVDALKVDKAVLFVQKSKTRLFQTQYSLQEGEDYNSDDLTKIVPEIAESQIKRLAVQRQPDTRVHCVLGNGRVAVLILDELENVKCWVTVSTDGLVEDVVVLPGDEEDKVYYAIKRTIDGSDVRYLERWSLESENARATYIYEGTSTTVIPVIVDDKILYPDGKVLTVRDANGAKIGNYTVASGAVTLGSAVEYASITPALYKISDAHLVYSGSSTATITGLNHLEGESVVAWGDGKDLGSYTVSSGSITLSESVETACVGLPYTARFKSVKLGDVALSGTVINQEKIINHVGLIMLDTHNSGLLYGQSFDSLDPMPKTLDWADIDEDFIHEEFDDQFIEFDGKWTTDARVCLEASSPRPCNILSCVVAMDIEEQNDRNTP